MYNFHVLFQPQQSYIASVLPSVIMSFWPFFSSSSSPLFFVCNVLGIAFHSPFMLANNLYALYIFLKWNKNHFFSHSASSPNNSTTLCCGWRFRCSSDVVFWLENRRRKAARKKNKMWLAWDMAIFLLLRRPRWMEKLLEVDEKEEKRGRRRKVHLPAPASHCRFIAFLCLCRKEYYFCSKRYFFCPTFLSQSPSSSHPFRASLKQQWMSYSRTRWEEEDEINYGWQWWKVEEVMDGREKISRSNCTNEV